VLEPTLAVIAPLFNEEENVQQLVARLNSIAPSTPCQMEIILVDDGSSDQTFARAKGLETVSDVSLRVLSHSSNRGIVTAWRTGLEASEAQYACLIDGDLQNPPEEIPDLLAACWSQPEALVQGVRSPVTRNHGDRLVLSRVFNSILNATLRDDARDNKSGFILGRRKNILQGLPLTTYTIFPQSFIRASARKRGFQFLEVNTSFHDRQFGKSFLERRGYWFNGLLALLDLPLAALRYRGRPDWTLKGTVRPDIPAKRTQEAARSRSSIVRERFYFSTLPIHSWQISKFETSEAYSFLTESQFFPRDVIRSFQEERLESLLAHAASRVPYYRNRISASNSGPMSHWGLLSGVPLLSKDLVRGNAHMRLFSETYDPKTVQRIKTSGSTGEPFVTYADAYQLGIRFATTLRAHRWTGWDFGDPQVRLWHQRLGMSGSQARREWLDARLLNRSFVPAFEFDQHALAQLIVHLNDRKPILIDGYAESLNFLATYLDGREKLEFQPSAVMSSAQTLTAQTRKKIEGALNTKVIDKYGAREFSGIAYQCGHDDRFHVMDESYVVEILVDGRPAEPGEVGEVVITDLNNYTFPLIRYRIGDLAMQAEQSPCECGRQLSSLGRIEGRTQALVFCANGRWLPGTFFAHFFKDFDFAIRFFQIHQEIAGEFTLFIVPAAGWTAATWNSIEDQLREFIGSTHVSVEIVNSIPMTLTGKRTPVVSRVKVDFQGLTQEQNG